MNINYDNLHPMDLVLCGASSPFAWITRLVTRKTLNRNVATHVGMVIDLYGQKVIAEMTGRGLSIDPLSYYIKNTKRNWIVGVKRHKVYDYETTRLLAQERVIVDFRRTIEYDYKGLLTFVFKRINDNHKRAYCSEYYYQQTIKDGIDYPSKFKAKVSPADLQDADGFSPIAWELK